MNWLQVLDKTNKKKRYKETDVVVGPQSCSTSEDLLVKDEVRGEVEHLSVGVFVGAPAEAEGRQTHPRVLDQGDLVLDGQAPETWHTQTHEEEITPIKNTVKKDIKVSS